MESSLNPQKMLDIALSPAFLVENNFIVYVNPAAQQRQVVVGTSVTDYITVGAEEYAEFTNGKLCLVLTLSGVSVNATVVRDNQYHIFYLESDYTEPELRAFALAAQHLREPLSNAMICANGLLPNLSVQGAADLQDQLSQLNKNLHQLHRAICNMSDAVEYQNTRPSRFEYREVGSIFNEVMEKASLLLSKGNHTLQYTGLSNHINTTVDAEKLERALLNMISNAVKFSPKDSVITASLRSSKNRLYFSLQNNCSNYADTQLGNIYSNYLREPGIEAPNKGIGLGMAIVQKTAAAHGGTLLLEQSDVFGIRFTMTVAIEPAKSTKLRSNVQLPIDYTGGYDHALTELSDVLPAELYK